MTSSDPPSASTPVAAAASPAAPPSARVVAQGHLHPGMLFLRLLDGLRQAVFPVILALVAQQTWLLVAAGMYFVLAMVAALVRFLTFEYRLTEEELITTEGILHRQERRIPVNRIQDLSFESTLIRRVFGLVVVSVETASSQGAEARLDSLSRRRAEQLREVLFRTRSQLGGAMAAAVVAPPERVLFRNTATDLFLLGLTNNRIGVILAALFGFYELGQEFGLIASLGGVFGQVARWLSQMHWLLMVSALVALVLAALIAGWLTSIGASFLMFFGFQLSVRDDVFLRRYGLLTARAASLPQRRIQRVLVEQTWLRRLLGLAVVRADSAGSALDPREQARGGRDVVVPMAELRRAEPLVPLLLPTVVPWLLQWFPVSPRVVLRIFLKGTTLAAIVAAALIPGVAWWAASALVLLPVAWVVGVLSFQNLGYAEGDGHVALRWGVLGRYCAYVPLPKVQGLVVRATPLDRMLGLAQLQIYVAGGAPTTLANLPADEAKRLQQRLGRAAARSRFVW